MLQLARLNYRVYPHMEDEVHPQVDYMKEPKA